MRSDLLALINTNRLAHNYHAVRACCGPNVKICVAIKANAYGHGIEVVAPTLQAVGVDCAAVATLQEAGNLRSTNWHKPILIIGNVLAVGDERERRERLRAIVRHRLTLTIGDPDTLSILKGLELQEPIDVHIKVDTGMGRMGCIPDDLPELIERVRSCPNTRLVGIYSHFATADDEDDSLVRQQLATFNRVLDDVGHILPQGIIRHLANSAAMMRYPEAHFDMVRPGLALYGYHPAEHLTPLLDLKPSMRLISHITALKTLPPDHCVGYGKAFTTTRQSRIGIVPIGYYDGFLRSLSNATVVTTEYGDAPVIGRVSMDQIAIDLTDLPPIDVGAEVTLLNDDPARPNSVVSVARKLNTIPYEVICLLGERIQRVTTGSFCATPMKNSALLNRTSDTIRCV